MAKVPAITWTVVELTSESGEVAAIPVSCFIGLGYLPPSSHQHSSSQID